MNERFEERYGQGRDCLLVTLEADNRFEWYGDLKDFIQSEIDLANKEGQEQYKRFILNVLDGRDQANIENGFATDTKSIRLAIQSKII